MPAHANFSIESSPESGELVAYFRPNLTDYRYAVSAAVQLGVPYDQIPDFDEVADRISPAEQAFLDEHVQRGDIPEFSFDIPLTDTRPIESVVTHYSVLAQNNGRSMGIVPHYPFVPDQWRLRAESDTCQRVTPSLVLSDSTNPLDRTQPANQFSPGFVHIGWNNGSEGSDDRLDEEVRLREINEMRRIVPGHVFVDMDVDAQRDAVATERAAGLERGVQLSPVSLTEFLVREGKMLIDSSIDMNETGEGQTIVNFVQYDDFPDLRTGELRVPSIHPVRPDMLGISFGQDVMSAHPYVGVRRVVRLALEG